MAHNRLAMVVSIALLALGGGGCGGSGGTGPADGTGAIEGYVFGRDGSRSQVAAGAEASRQATPPSGTVALNDARVTIASVSRHTDTGADRSGQAGFFRILGLTPGSYAVTVSRQGYVDATFTAAVKAGETTLAGIDGGQTVLEPEGPAPSRKWTVMVYMDADGDLEEYGILNVNQMETLGSDANVNLVVQFDRGPGFDATNGDWTDTRRYLVTKDSNLAQISSPVLQNLGEVDMGQPEALTDFITWAKTQYPADRYCLVLWNHGAGWRSRSVGQAAASRGIIFDDTSGSALTMGELDSGMAASGVHFDLVAIDCSLMGMLEVYYEIRARTDYVCGSEESPPGPGYPYDRILARLVANPGASAEELGRAFVEEHVAAYRDGVTQAMVRTSALPAFCAKVDQFAAVLLPLARANRALFESARTQSQVYGYSYYRDLYDFVGIAKELFADPGLASAADAVLNGQAAGSGGPVVAEAHSSGSVGRSHGISIHLPSYTQYGSTSAALVGGSTYGDLQFTRAYPRWDELIRPAP